MKTKTHPTVKFSFFNYSSSAQKPTTNSIPLTFNALTTTDSYSLISPPKFLSISIYTICLALGITQLSDFSTGLLIGFATNIAAITLHVLWDSILPLSVESSASNHFVSNNFLSVTIIIPLIEEYIFRGLLLHILLSLTSHYLPDSTIMKFSDTDITLANSASVIVSAGIFGIAHYANGYFRVFLATLFGLISGVVALELGLGASVGQHISHNSISTVIVLFNEIQKQDELFKKIHTLQLRTSKIEERMHDSSLSESQHEQNYNELKLMLKESILLQNLFKDSAIISSETITELPPSSTDLDENVLPSMNYR